MRSLVHFWRRSRRQTAVVNLQIVSRVLTDGPMWPGLANKTAAAY